jgi:hypothetical protein
MIDFVIAFIDKLKTHGLEKTVGRYYSCYRAQVTDNKDPKKLGYIKVKIPILFADNEFSGWVKPKCFVNSGMQYGSFFPPEIDDWVWVEFENGDTKYGVYSGGWFGTDEMPEDLGYDGEIPTKRGWTFKNGSKIIIDESEGKNSLKLASKAGGDEEMVIHLDMTDGAEKLSVLSKNHSFEMNDAEETVSLIHKSKTTILIEKDGSTSIKSSKGATISISDADGTVLVKTKDGAQIEMKEKIQLKDKAGNTATLSDSGIELNTSKDVKVKAGKAMMNLVGGKVKLGTDQAEVVDILHKTLTALGKTTAPGYNGPISTVADFIELTTKISQIKS